MPKFLVKALVVFSLLAACFAGVGIYSRFFDEAGGMFCPVRHEAVQLRNMNICHWTGVSMEVLELLRTDVRNTGDPHKVLIKYTDGIVYQCFWFDDREFDYSIDGLEPSSIRSGCPDNHRNLTMTRQLRHD